MGAIDEVTLYFNPGLLYGLNAVLGIVMFSIAIDLTARDFRLLIRAPRALIVGLLAQFVVLPAVTFALVLVSQPRASIALGLIVVAACPGGNISNFLSHRARGNTALSVSLTACATMASILLTPLNIAFWGSLYAPSRAILHKTAIDPLGTAVMIALILVFPLAAGVALNMRRPELTARLRVPLQYVAFGIFIGLVTIALVANWTLFLRFAGNIGGLVVLHNALALAAGFAFATLAGLSKRDRRAVTIETGIQNSGLALVLIFGFFGGLGGMAVVAALWGIWHAVSGIALATVMARRNPVRRSAF